MILCNNCYKNKNLPKGGGRQWVWGKRKKDKWGKNLKEYESCSECCKDGGLLTETTGSGEWKETAKKRFWRPMKLTVDPEWEKKQKTKQDQLKIAEKIRKYRQPHKA